jgi:hypothetical protein
VRRAIKWRRYAGLRERIAAHPQLERRLMDAYQQGSRIPMPCGTERRRLNALLAVAARERCLIAECEREIRRLW